MKFFLFNIVAEKIRYKIMAGFLVVAALMLGVVFSAISYVKQISEQVNDITNNLALQMNLTMEIESKAVLARVYANSYAAEYSQDVMNQFIRNYNELNQVINQLHSIVVDPERHILLENMSRSVQEYGKIFTYIVDLVQNQEKTVFNEVERNSYIIDNRLTALRVAISSHGNFLQFLAFGNVQMSCMQMQNHFIKFMKDKNERHAVLLRKAFADALHDLESLISMSDVSVDVKNAADAESAVKGFFNGFEKIYDVSSELNFLLKNTLNDLESLIKESTKNSVESIKNEYKFHNESSKDILKKSWQLLIAAAAFALFIGTVISFFISARITEPIAQLMTASLKIADKDLYELSKQLAALSKGDLRHDFHITSSILNIKEKDEVGEMAKAFNNIIYQLQYTAKVFGDMKKYLRNTASTAHAVADGNLLVKPDVISEYDELGNSISTMVKNLRDSDTKVKEYQNHLQELVEKKTAELQQSNNKLKITNKALNKEIEERKDIEHALRESKNQLDLAIQAALMGIWEWHPDTDKMLLSGEHFTILGTDKDNFNNSFMDFQNYIHAEDKEYLKEFFNSFALTSCYEVDEQKKDISNKRSIIYKIVMNDGNIRWLISHAKPIIERTESACLLRIVGTTQDITERIMAEQEMSEKKKLSAVMETAGAVCHELNQPLHIISGCCELLKNEFITKESGISSNLHRKLEMIVKQVKRMAALNHNLMNITSYKTKSYLTSTIIDINASSEKERSK